MNQFITTSMILQESLMVLKNNCQFARYVNRQYDSQFAKSGAKVGATVNARKPPKYQGRYGNGLQPEDIVETPVPVTCDKLFGVDLEFTDVDLTLTMDNFRQRYIEPAVSRIANEIDATGLQLYNQIYNSVGTPGTVPADAITYLNSGVKLDNTGTPRRGKTTRTSVIGSQMQATLVDALKGLFQSSDKIREQYEEGEMGQSLGLNFSMDQNVFTHTVGPLGGTPLVNGANQTGSNLVTDGWTAAAANRLKKGDVFTIANVYGIKPQTGSATGGVSTGQLQQFVCTDDVDSDAGGATTIPISPSIILAGAFATVNSLPADNAALTVVGAANTVTPQGLSFHRDAFTLVMVDLEMPKGVDMAGRIVDEDTGFAMRMVRAYDIRTNTRPVRLEALWGWSVLYPEMACRIAS